MEKKYLYITGKTSDNIQIKSLILMKIKIKYLNDIILEKDGYFYTILHNGSIIGYYLNISDYSVESQIEHYSNTNALVLEYFRFIPKIKYIYDKSEDLSYICDLSGDLNIFSKLQAYYGDTLVAEGYRCIATHAVYSMEPTYSYEEVEKKIKENGFISRFEIKINHNDIPCHCEKNIRVRYGSNTQYLIYGLDKDYFICHSEYEKIFTRLENLRKF